MILLGRDSCVERVILELGTGILIFKLWFRVYDIMSKKTNFCVRILSLSYRFRIHKLRNFWPVTELTSLNLIFSICGVISVITIIVIIQ